MGHSTTTTRVSARRPLRDSTNVASNTRCGCTVPWSWTVVEHASDTSGIECCDTLPWNKSPRAQRKPYSSRASIETTICGRGYPWVTTSFSIVHYKYVNTCSQMHMAFSHSHAFPSHALAGADIGGQRKQNGCLPMSRALQSSKLRKMGKKDNEIQRIALNF